MEIDLLRTRQRVFAIPEWRLRQLDVFDYVVCVNRWPQRNRFALYPRKLCERLPRVAIPLMAPDPDVPLDLQEILEQVYSEGRYVKRIRYDEPCDSPLSEELQRWATERIAH